MDQARIERAVNRIEAALARIESAAAAPAPAPSTPDDTLRQRVRDTLGELDRLIESLEA